MILLGAFRMLFSSTPALPFLWEVFNICPAGKMLNTSSVQDLSRGTDLEHFGHGGILRSCTQYTLRPLPQPNDYGSVTTDSYYTRKQIPKPELGRFIAVVTSPRHHGEGFIN